jgi:UDP-N-acetylglucosamine 2-epimerase (non-hydrolysing)
MIKILTILGTRPEIIRLSQIIPKLDKYSKHILVHTGQNYDYNLDRIFFKDLRVRKPDYYLSARGTFANQIAKILTGLEKIIANERPDKFLVLGDTNSSLGAIAAKRLGVPVYHMEAGNRSFIKRAPEETNRKIIDHSSDILLPYSRRSADNLLDEGIPRKAIYVTGNPIFEVLKKFEEEINNSNILKKLNIKKNNFFLLTLHREENVDNILRFKKLIKIINLIRKKYNYNIIWPIHPRSKKKIIKLKLKIDKKIFLINPLGFFDFVNLEKNSYCVLTDSGTVQEETSILKVPSIVLRESTERPETLESGATIVDDNIESILDNIKVSIDSKDSIEIPSDYIKENVSWTVTKILTSKYF